jgi:copper resistance protein B
MKFNFSTARTVFATTFILTASVFQPSAGWAQADMKDMPGMAPKATPTPKKAAPAATAKPAAAAMSQKEMDAMPGMAPTAATTSKEDAPTVTTPTDSAKAPAAMDDMPGMSQAKPATSKSAGPVPAKNDMDGMPGMAAPGASKTKGMAAMPGMPAGGASKKGMAGMPGMPAGEASTPKRMSAPGVFILRPPQKWVPPRGDNRAAELLSRPALEQLMKPLPPPVEDSLLHGFLLTELLEYRANSAGPNAFVWDFVGWFGGDYNRLWVKTEGRQDLSDGNRGEGDLQLLYGRLIAPFWDLQLGVREKFNLGSGLRDNTRTYAVIGLQGLAPGNFDVEPAIYVSDRGEVSAELTVSADLYLTQRLVLQPRFQGEVSVQGDDRFGTGSGVAETDIGLRLRYEIRREIAPYIGVSWLKQYGETARISRQQGETSDTVALVLGLRLWW